MTTGELALDAYPSAGMRAGARRSAVRAGLWLSCNRAAGFKAGMMRGVTLPRPFCRLWHLPCGVFPIPCNDGTNVPILPHGAAGANG